MEDLRSYSIHINTEANNLYNFVRLVDTKMNMNYILHSIRKIRREINEYIRYYELNRICLFDEYLDIVNAVNTLEDITDILCN